jgi:single-stranded DNA-binding protein
MILITVHGRLAHQPEVKILPNGASCCEFRLLSTRFAKGAEHLEAVTFFCYDKDAERFCDNTEKGQLISASGTQETQRYESQGQERHFIKYRLNWFEKGPKPQRANRVPASDVVPGTRDQGRSTSQPLAPAAHGDRESGRSDGFI